MERQQVLANPPRYMIAAPDLVLKEGDFVMMMCADVMKERRIIIMVRRILIKERRIVINEPLIVIKERHIVIKEGRIVIMMSGIVIRTRRIVIMERRTFIKERFIIISASLIIIIKSRSFIMKCAGLLSEQLGNKAVASFVRPPRIGLPGSRLSLGQNPPKRTEMLNLATTIRYISYEKVSNSGLAEVYLATRMKWSEKPATKAVGGR
jgi:hypothetical protein